MFPTFPTSSIFSWEIEEMVRKIFLCFLPFLRVLYFREKLEESINSIEDLLSIQSSSHQEYLEHKN